MFPQSMRARLTFWNVVVLALVLSVFGVILCYSVRANLRVTTDQELSGMAHDLQRMARVELADRVQNRNRRLQPGSPAMPADDALRIYARLIRRSARLTLDMNGRRRAYFRRPRLLTPDGKSLIPETHDSPWDAASCQLAASGRERFSLVAVGGESLRVLSVPLVREGEKRAFGVIQLAYPLGEQERLYDSQVQALLMLIPLALVIAGAGGLFLTERALRPVRQVTRAAGEITADNLSQRLEVRGRDELAELSVTFNGMTARLEAAFQQLGHAYHQLEGSLELQKRFTADASHELRTPLSRIKLTTSLTLSAPRTSADYEEALALVEGEADRLNRIVLDLLLLARADAEQLRTRMEPIKIQDLLEDVIHDFSTPDGPELRLTADGEGVSILGDAISLERLVSNLVENAIRHTPPAGCVILSAVSSEEFVQITVEDTGEGIAPEHLPHLCERFYRVDPARGGTGGTGLGLAICQSIVQAHRGWLRIESEMGRGTQVVVTLPPAIRPEAAPPLFTDEALATA